MVKKILILVDDQAPDACLVEKSIEFAGQLKADLGLIDIARLSIGYVEAGIYPPDLEEIDLKRAVNTVKKIMDQFPDTKFENFEQVGDTIEELGAVVNEWNPNMLVVGHHKHSFLQRVSENSKERRIINHLNIPVLVIPCDE